MAHAFLQEQTDLFGSIEPVGSRKRAFWMSVGIHFGLVIVLIVIPLIFTETLKLKYEFVELVPPLIEQKPIMELTHWKQPPTPKVEPKPLIEPPAPRKVHLVQPELRKPEPRVEEVKPEPISVPKTATRFPGPELEQPAAPGPPKPTVRTDVFSTGSSAKPTTDLPAREVQTGGFGDPNGVKGEGRPDKITNIASLGSFDLPVGPGVGNGTGGASGVRGIVASAGFGNGVATVGSGPSGGGGSGKGVRQGGFGDAGGAQVTTVARKRDMGPPQTSVEILSKPRPDYTEEARKRKIEGEVLVRALFAANGEVRVMDVIRGLGFGLDENALKAAQQIRFKPAVRDGQPVDSIATVRITFQLAY